MQRRYFFFFFFLFCNTITISHLHGVLLSFWLQRTLPAWIWACVLNHHMYKHIVTHIWEKNALCQVKGCQSGRMTRLLCGSVGPQQARSVCEGRPDLYQGISIMHLCLLRILPVRATHQSFSMHAAAY